MTHTRIRNTLSSAIALAAVLALSACGGAETPDGTAPAAAPIAAIAAPAGQNWLDTAANTPEGGVVQGNPEAPIKLVEYASHTCSHCAAFAEESAGKIETYITSGRVSYELRNQIHDPVDLTISLLARCGEPTAFHPLAHEVWGNLAPIFEKVQANPAAMQGTGDDRFVKIADAAGLLDFFAARGVSRDKATQCLGDTAKAESILNASNTQSEELGVTGTPTFFLNGAKLDASNWTAVEAALQTAGAR